MKCKLKVHIDSDGIYSSLAYTNLANGESYILNDFTALNTDKLLSILEEGSNSFWIAYFRDLGRKFGWQILDNLDANIISMKPLVSEYVGISEYEIAAEERISAMLIDFPREYVKKIDLKSHEGIIRKVTMKLGYREMLYLDVNKHSIKIVRIDGESLENAGQYELRSDLDDTVLQIKDGVISRVSYVTNNIDINLWANEIYSDNENIVDESVYDAYNAYFLKSLMQFSRKKDAFAKNSQAVIITGSATRLLDIKFLSKLIIDGLGFNKDFDLFVDPNKNIINWGYNYFFGSNAKDIIIRSKDIIPPAKKVLIPSVFDRKDIRKVFAKYQFDQDYSYVYTPEINIIDIPDYLSKNYVFNIKATDRGKFQSEKIIFDPLKTVFDSIVVDCRNKPVVYGATSKDNRKRLKLWGLLK